ncbi:hypothetical protein [Paenibacillus alvei]|uniref:Uncharacterized protein n=1 Tax=Paenibacillus alvei TaxID=44250 RepID=A0AAP6ZUV5_PAEAL|nr:hypothetical protein [Paenibacillus alvei]MBG9735623.1 hypothetical protein [Paenibacillus alvei]MBG9746647.1 hypothetical protein [Paenibacillus alvei]MCY9578416.1 hypothetical protein [Paenibacillus alvei]MCY9584737.1 hypothetical protein [Paenibacillus alvei]NEZ41184.1 hypothetical protein [Paenibacillus alvei]
MMDKLRPLIGSNLQVATALETTTGTLVSVDENKLTLRTSSVSGYENGQYAIFPLKSISYIRII